MSWFKVDDKLPKNRKFRKVRRSHPAKHRDVAPIGLWAIAGAESDDGFIATEVLLDHDDDAEALAARLVSAGFWRPASRDGEPGFTFHDWGHHNPVDAASSGTFGNHVRWHQKRGKTDPDCPHCAALESQDDRGDDRGDIAPESLPVPTRPVPTRISSASAAADPGEKFEEFWDAYGKKVDRKAAEQKWRLALRKPGVDADMLIAAAARYVAHERTSNQGGRFIMGPAKWLLNERWKDEPESNVRSLRPDSDGRIELPPLPKDFFS